MQMKLKQILILAGVAAVFAACTVKPPVQEMAEARSALKTAQEIEGRDARADRYLQSAEEALQEAAGAIDAQQYERARRKAVEARRDAQQAARIKQSRK